MLRVARSLRRYVVVSGTVFIAFAAASSRLPAVAVAGPAPDGAVVIVDANHQGMPLSGLGNDETFSLRLPEHATCPGDSYNDNWRVQTFLLPIGDDPSTILFSGVGPEGTENDNRWPLRQVNSFNYVDQLTVANAVPGQPGIIERLPPLSTKSFTRDEVPTGRYRLGIACTLDREVGRFWEVEVLIDSESADGPVWTPDQAPTVEVDGQSNGSGTPLLAGTVGIAAIGCAVVLRRRNRNLTKA